MGYFPNCDGCGEQIRGNVRAVREGKDRVEYCETCDNEVGRVENIDDKTVSIGRF